MDRSDMDIKDLQNYIPIYQKFFSLNNENFNIINLNTPKYLVDLKEVKSPTEIKGVLKNDNNDKTQISDIFIKYSPILNPLKYLSGKYENIDIMQLPIYNKPSIIEKKDCVNNTAYVDSFMSYLSSNLLHTHNFFHGLDFFGSFVGIKQDFTYNIADDIEILYNNSFFHKNTGTLFNLPEEIDSNYFDDSSRKYKNKISISDDVSALSVNSLDNDIICAFTTKSPIHNSENNLGIDIDIHPTNRTKLEMDTLSDISSDASSDTSSDTSSCTESDTESISQYSSSSNTSSEEDDIFIKINKFPCQAILLEQCEDTLDSLMESESLTDEEWISALFQVVVILYTYQHCFDMTHNDLHTNNIMFITTEKKFLYYYIEGSYYKIPTFGRIYKIIDFGRAIYRFNKELMCSDSYGPKEDAYGQYNCEPFLNKKVPKLEPNRSFDLCRLACSIFDYFIEDMDEVENMKKESRVFNIINEWLRDDKGRNILYKKTGEERYHDFKLYKMIARTVHSHTPKAQFEKNIFSSYKIPKRKLNKHAKIMNIDKLPIYYS